MFTIENTDGYAQAQLDSLNAEFTARWNGWNVPEDQLFFYANGEHMEEEMAWKQFAAEVAGR